MRPLEKRRSYANHASSAAAAFRPTNVIHPPNSRSTTTAAWTTAGTTASSTCVVATSTPSGSGIVCVPRPADVELRILRCGIRVKLKQKLEFAFLVNLDSRRQYDSRHSTCVSQSRIRAKQRASGGWKMYRLHTENRLTKYRPRKKYTLSRKRMTRAERGGLYQ